MALFRKAPARRGPDELRDAFLDACASIQATRNAYKRATEKATDSELYRMPQRLQRDLGLIYLYIDGILDEYLELRDAGLQ